MKKSLRLSLICLPLAAGALLLPLTACGGSEEPPAVFSSPSGQSAPASAAEQTESVQDRAYYFVPSDASSLPDTVPSDDPNDSELVREGNFLFYIYDDHVAVAGYDGQDDEVYIPDTVNGKPVTVIADHAFRFLQGVQSLRIPETVVKIEQGAFFSSGDLKSVNLPAGLKEIGKDAFNGCSIESLTIPEGITVIREGSFADSSLKSITLPQSVTVIESLAFSRCASLEYVELPNHMDSIGRYAFSDCTALTEFTIPDGIEVIENDTFYSCKNLTTVSIPDTVRNIRESAFLGCASLSSVEIPADAVYSVSSFSPNTTVIKK